MVAESMLLCYSVRRTCVLSILPPFFILKEKIVNGNKLELIPGEGNLATKVTISEEETRKAHERVIARMEQNAGVGSRSHASCTIPVGTCFCSGTIKYKRHFQVIGEPRKGQRNIPREEVWECYCTRCGLQYHRDAELIAPVIKEYFDSL